MHKLTVFIIFFICIILTDNYLVAECNSLYKEKNPYLLQHKSNPVCWKPWSSKTLEFAKKVNKPIFLSIGYSSCYWCHVMEEESFSKKDVAYLLNKYFVSIKLDREERPDIDKFYMDAAYKLNGKGGWPLSMFLTSTSKPFFSGTYFKKEDFKKIITKLGSSWRKDSSAFKIKGLKVLNELKNLAVQKSSINLDKKIIKKAFLKNSKYFDKKHGGFGSRLKFPPHQKLNFLLNYYNDSKDESALEQVNTTLKKMAHSGMYDHLNGGFMRYSTTRDWNVPHFEKMLYDNAQLANIYLKAYQITKQGMYESIGREILDFILVEMTDKRGGFYSAFDAGKINKEGLFYTWEKEEIKNLLSSKEYKLLANLFKFIPHNSDHEKRYILVFKENSNWEDRYDLEIFNILQKINSYREKRKKPFLDKKIITAWNALMITSFSNAYNILSESRYLLAATNTANFLEKNLFINGKLNRRFILNETKYDATLDDYAYLVEAFLTLFEASEDIKWFNLAKSVQEAQNKTLWDLNDGAYFYAKDNNIPIRQKRFRGQTLPASNAISLLNLYKLYSFTLDDSYLSYANKTLGVISNKIEKNPERYLEYLSALYFFYNGFKQYILVEGLDKLSFINMRDLINDAYLPHKIFLKVNSSLKKANHFKILKRKKALKGLTTLYICKDNTCEEPISDLDILAKFLVD